MSLLLEALKKAEIAKQGARPGASSPASLDFEPSAEPQRDTPPVATRERLPEISQPLDIAFPLNRQTVQESVAPRPLAAAPEQAPRPEPVESTELPAYEPVIHELPPPASADRAAARQLFEAKEMDYNPKRPFHITLGVLALGAIGYGGYLWWQLQPRTAYNNQAVQAAQKAGPAAPSPVPPPAVQDGDPATAAAPADGGSAPPQPSTTAQAAPPVAPRADPPAANVPQPPQPGPSRSAAPLPSRATPAGTPPNQVAAPAAPARESVAAEPRPGPAARGRAAPSIDITPSTATLDPSLANAYAAYQRGDLAAAREQYRIVLQRDAGNRDALLGMAAIDMRTRNFETAEMRYLRLIEIDPRDSHAHAGLLALRGQLDPVQAESRIKTMIAGQPDSTHLYFTLGNQYAQQQRWPEAQQAYFKAYSAEPENPDYAYNLAVALDHMRQKKQALEYYQRAVALSEGRSPGFDKARADSRIQELQR